jgi:cytosine/adenosine deaminase-related metal-dependent hydrolase
VSLSLGSDQQAVIDPFEDLRGLEMNDRIVSGQRGRFSPRHLLTAATSDGYASLGWAGGSIAPGQLCDLVAIDDRSPRTAGAEPAQLWLAATSADVTHVVVGGRTVVSERRHTLGDVGALLDDSIRRLL